MYGSAIRIVLVCFGGFEVGAYWLDPSLGPIISQVQAAHFKSYGEDGTEGLERQRVEEDVWPAGQPIYLHVHLQLHACHLPLELRLLSREPQPRNNPEA